MTRMINLSLSLSKKRLFLFSPDCTSPKKYYTWAFLQNVWQLFSMFGSCIHFTRWKEGEKKEFSGEGAFWKTASSAASRRRDAMLDALFKKS